MRLLKSEKAQIWLSLAGIVFALMIFYGLPPVLAKAFANHPGQQVDVRQSYLFEPAKVNLPYGEKFVAIGPELGRSGRKTYITEKRPEGESPRRLTFFVPGDTPHSWEAVLYIQEH